MKDANWLWKPPRGVSAQITRGNKHCDPMRHVKLAKRAEAVMFRAQAEGESAESYEMVLRQAEQINRKLGRAS